MSVVNISASRNVPETDHDPLAQLAASLSGRLTRVPLDGMPATMAQALAEIAAAIRVENCRLLEFTGSAMVGRIHSATGTVRPPDGAHHVLAEDWLVERLWRGELVSVSRPEELPRRRWPAASNRLAGAYSILGVPASPSQVCARWWSMRRLPRRGRRAGRAPAKLTDPRGGVAARPPRDRPAREVTVIERSMPGPKRTTAT